MITKADKIIYHLGYVGISIAAFAWGWNWKKFK